MEREGPFWDFVAGRADPPPAARTLGWQLEEVDPAAGTILAAMLDDTLGPALVATLGPDQFAPTLELKVNFVRPAHPGRLVGTGRVVHRGGTIAFLEGDLHDAEGTLIATATATARIVRSK